VPHHCRRIGHAGLAGAIFEYGRNLGTGDWSTLSHLSDMDLTVVRAIEGVICSDEGGALITIARSDSCYANADC
jgi:hypothetical protein